MKVNGICKDCASRWQSGLKGNKQHLWCTEQSRKITNTKMSSCPFYRPASEEEIHSMRLRGCGGIPVKRKEM